MRRVSETGLAASRRGMADFRIVADVAKMIQGRRTSVHLREIWIHSAVIAGRRPCPRRLARWWLLGEELSHETLVRPADGCPMHGHSVSRRRPDRDWQHLRNR